LSTGFANLTDLAYPPGQGDGLHNRIVSCFEIALEEWLLLIDFFLRILYDYSQEDPTVSVGYMIFLV
jgi:hypothetical protein